MCPTMATLGAAADTPELLSQQPGLSPSELCFWVDFLKSLLFSLLSSQMPHTALLVCGKTPLTGYAARASTCAAMLRDLLIAPESCRDLHCWLAGASSPHKAPLFHLFPPSPWVGHTQQLLEAFFPSATVLHHHCLVLAAIIGSLGVIYFS